ncbi:MAG: HU family DNA-binding protein [Bacteroidota bacterium]|nr:HU family DNA-binding protein [Bacteroidota bacterium]
MRMTKAELVKSVSDAVGAGVSRRECAAVTDALLAAIVDTLERGESVDIRGFGIFKVRHLAARMGRNPGTGEPVQIAARTSPVFRPSKAFRERVNTGA